MKIVCQVSVRMFDQNTRLPRSPNLHSHIFLIVINDMIVANCASMCVLSTYMSSGHCVKISWLIPIFSNREYRWSIRSDRPLSKNKIIFDPNYQLSCFIFTWLEFKYKDDGNLSAKVAKLSAASGFKLRHATTRPTHVLVTKILTNHDSDLYMKIFVHGCYIKFWKDQV